MWNEIINNNDLQEFMKKIDYFHDSCIKELKYLKLFPENEEYTCEITDSTMIMRNNLIYWCDCGDLSVSDLESYDGTLICASKLRWRSIDNCIGKKEFFVSIL